MCAGTVPSPTIEPDPPSAATREFHTSPVLEARAASVDPQIRYVSSTGTRNTIGSGHAHTQVWTVTPARGLLVSRELGSSSSLETVCGRPGAVHHMPSSAWGSVVRCGCVGSAGPRCDIRDNVRSSAQSKQCGRRASCGGPRSPIRAMQNNMYRQCSAQLSASEAQRSNSEHVRTHAQSTQDGRHWQNGSEGGARRGETLSIMKLLPSRRRPPRRRAVETTAGFPVLGRVNR